MAAASLLVALADQGESPFDTELFIASSRVLFSRRWHDAFADPIVQVGPLYLVVCRILAAVAGALRVDFTVVFGPVTEIAAALAVVAGVRGIRRIAGLGSSPGLELGIGLLAVAWNLPSGAYLYGHPGQVAIPLLWLMAAGRARDGRWVSAAAAVAVAAGLETWGVLGVPVLLLVVPWLRALCAGALAAAAAAFWYAPFVLFGEFNMGELDWIVRPTAPLAHFLAVGTPVGWPWRLLQASLAFAAAASLAVVCRYARSVVWAVPLMVVVVRLALDPVNHSYYWISAQVICLMAVAALAPPITRLHLCGFALLYVTLLVEVVDVLVASSVVLVGIVVVCRADLSVSSLLKPGSTSADAPDRLARST